MTDYKAMAEAQARLSRCNRRRVGAALVHPVGWVFLGHNHSTDGGPCECEQGVTRSSVVHAEEAAIWSAHSVDLAGAVLYVTHQPCINCARLIVARGIRAVHYRDADDKQDGLELLRDAGVRAERWPTQQQLEQQRQAQEAERLRQLEALGGHTPARELDPFDPADWPAYCRGLYQLGQRPCESLVSYHAARMQQEER